MAGIAASIRTAVEGMIGRNTAWSHRSFKAMRETSVKEGASGRDALALVRPAGQPCNLGILSPTTIRLNYGVGDTGTALKNEFKFEVSHE